MDNANLVVKHYSHFSLPINNENNCFYHRRAYFSTLLQLGRLPVEGMGKLAGFLFKVSGMKFMKLKLIKCLSVKSFLKKYLLQVWWVRFSRIKPCIVYFGLVLVMISVITKQTYQHNSYINTTCLKPVISKLLLIL